jgi:hypothetical protein
MRQHFVFWMVLDDTTHAYVLHGDNHQPLLLAAKSCESYDGQTRNTPRLNAEHDMKGGAPDPDKSLR